MLHSEQKRTIMFLAADKNVYQRMTCCFLAARHWHCALLARTAVLGNYHQLKITGVAAAQWSFNSVQNNHSTFVF